MPVFPGDSPPQRTWDAHPNHGNADEVSRWVLGAHTGTHVDAPRHFVPEGQDVEAVGLHPFVGPARVVDVSHCAGPIDAEGLAIAPIGRATRVLLRTSNSLHRVGRHGFDEDYVALTADAARALLAAGVSTVGVDYLSVDPYSRADDFDYPAHRELLGAGVAVIEGLDLSQVAAGDYFLCCLPLRLLDSEASPARAVLFPNATPIAEAPLQGDLVV